MRKKTAIMPSPPLLNGRPVIIPDGQVNDIKNGKDINLLLNSKEDIKVSVVKHHRFSFRH